MELQAVRIQNFMSVESAVVDYTGMGTTLVVGPTGSGKSALLVEPLLWQFYDTLNRPVSKSKMGGVRRRYRQQDVKEPTSVETWFTNAGHTYYVKRSLKDGWEISRDGATVTPYKVKADGVSAMRQAIGLPPHLFRAIAVMGQGFQERFTGFKDSDRTTIIEDFLGAAAFEEGQREAKEKSAAVEAALRSLIARRQTLEQAVTTTSGQIEAVEQQTESVKAGVNAARVRFEAEAETLGEQRGIYMNHQITLTTAQTETAALITQLEFDQRTTQTAVNGQHTLIGSLSSMEGTLGQTRNRLLALGDQCPSCFQKVNAAIVTAEVGRLGVEFNAVAVQKQEAVTQLETLQEHVRDVGNELAMHRTTHQTRQQELNQVAANIQSVDTRFQQVQTELTNVGEAEIVAEKNLRLWQERLATEKDQLAVAVTAEAEYVRRKPYLSWWVEGFSIRGIRSKRLGSVLETMNASLAGYCDKLFDGVRVRLLPVKPQKTAAAKSVVSVEVSSPAGSYEFSSGGQERCIDLAIHFALRRFAQGAAFGWSSNFIVGDEVFDHLDRPLAERALEILKGEAKRVFLVTHSPSMQSLCDSTWRVLYDDERTVLA